MGLLLVESGLVDFAMRGGRRLLVDCAGIDRFELALAASKLAK